MSETKPPDDKAPEAAASSRLEELHRLWDTVRNHGRSRGFVRRAADFVRGTSARARNHAGDLERDLLREMIDGQNALEAKLARLQASTADILGALDAMWSLHAKHEAGGGNAETANLRDRHEILRVRQTRLEGALADLREELAALSGGPPAPPLPLTPRDVAEILATLERGAPAAGAVEVSFQDARAERLLLAARRHFGGRLSSSASPYRGPNDLWIHMDFTADWNRRILLENAASRLAPAGRFVLVTAPAAGDPPEHSGLELEEDRQLALAAAGEVRALIWRKT